MTQLSRAQLKREAKAARRAERQARTAGGRRAGLKIAVISAAVVAVVVLAIILLGSSGPQPGAYYPSEGRGHIAPGAPHPPYQTNPPTSGPHYPTPANWGIYTETLPDEQIVHNLEHGGVWISYKDPSDKTLVASLTALAKEYKSKIILEPRPANDSPIALVAWQRLEKLEKFNEAAVREFIKAYKDRGPEYIPDNVDSSALHN